ncbi:MAG: DUF2723 domain-containing protein [Candidatus Latescibacteria bacterium]|nr:DUF2723 domain-containing protein [Candidatus Latescibacterota bacterium]
MPRTEQLHRLAGAGVFLAALLLYLKSMATTVSFWDCGEFIACSYTMGVPHPPGSPLYVLLGRVFTLLPLGSPAARVVFMSGLTSALAVWCVYLSTVALSRRVMGGTSHQAFGDQRDLSVILGAAVAALCLGCSYTFWFNAVEAEVYGYSIFFTALGVWLILFWEGTQHGTSNDKWLYLIAYAFGLGGGLHMLCLLTIPTLLILAWYADEKLRRLIVLLLVLAGWSVLSMAALGSRGGYLPIAIALAGLAYYLYRTDQRACWLLLGSLLLFGLGYSTYAALYVRSGLNPTIDENDPETWAAFIKFFNREQYGTKSNLLEMFSPQASRTYQFWYLQAKYFFQQFPFPFLTKMVVFRKATENAADPVAVSLIPYLLGLGGMVWHAQRDRRRFLAFFAMFVIMGFGLSLYLNMPDPQPRERHYVFGGMFYAFALWMGLGWTGLVEYLRERFKLGNHLATTVACLGLILPVGIATQLYHQEDRTDDYIAFDYGYNILQSADPNGIIFTNGDNDTFPLWYLQEVEGIRKDVSVVNLSLLNTGWYIKQLRDREPKINIQLDDTYIDSVLCDTQLVDLYKRVWPETRIPVEFKKLGLEVEVPAKTDGGILRVQDIMVIGILYWNQWQRPVHFAITVSGENRLNLDPYLQMTGMGLRVVRQKDAGTDLAALEHNLLEVYRFRGVNDPEIFKDEDADRLMGNYMACVLELAQSYQRVGRGPDMERLFQWAKERFPFSWRDYYAASELLRQAKQNALGAEYIEQAGKLTMADWDQDPKLAYENTLALAGILLNSYSEYDRAEGLYRQAMGRNPGQWDAYYELAATLQAKGQPQQALEMLEQYRAKYGEKEELKKAEDILHRALSRNAEPSAPAQP